MSRTPGGTDAAAPDAVQRARDVVTFTRRTSRRDHRTGSPLRRTAGDLYLSALAGACALVLAVSSVVALHDGIADRGQGPANLDAVHRYVVPAEYLWMVVTCLVLVAVARTARSFGPVAVGPAEGVWWLPLPVGRRPMVLPPFERRLAVVGAAATAVSAVLAYVTASVHSAWELVAAAGTFGLGTVLAVLGAAVLQLDQVPAAVRRVMIVGTVPMAVLPFLASSSVWPLPLMLLSTVVLLAFVHPRAGGIPGRELHAGGAASRHAGASLVALDANELHRAMQVRSPLSVRRCGSRFYARPTRWPISAVVRADVVAFLRLQPVPVGALVWLGSCVATTSITPALPLVLQLATVLLAGCAVTAGCGSVARHAAVVEELDALLPLNPKLVRCSRMLMPAITLAGWMSVLGAALVLLGSAPAALVPLGAVAGLGMGAGAVRGATRPVTDWTTSPIDTPFGAIPVQQIVSLLRGTDMTVLAMTPVLLALHLGTVPAPLLLAQIIITVLLITVQASSPTTR